jgi:hypothetical protein
VSGEDQHTGKDRGDARAPLGRRQHV